MSFDKFLNKAKNMANDPKVREKLKSEKAEKASDSILDKAAGVAESLTNGKHTEKIKKARDAADRAVGTDGAEGTEGKSGPGQTEGGSSRGQQSESEHTQGERTQGERTQGEGESRP